MPARFALSSLLPSPWRGGPDPWAPDDVAAPQRSLGLALKVLADEFVLALAFASHRRPSREAERRIAAEVDAARELFQERGWIDDPLAYHRAPPPLESVRLRPADSLGTRFQHLEFDSGYEPHFGEPGRARWLNYRPNETAHAWVLQHRGPPRPWLMCLHGYGMGTPAVDLAGFRATWLHRRLGLNVILPVLPLHGPRKLGGRSGDGFLSGDILNAVHGEAQAIWDLRRILSWLRGQGAPAVGVYGLSLGGYTAALLAAFAHNLACVIAGIPATDFFRLAHQHMPALLTRYAREAGIASYDHEPVLRVISPLAFAPRVPRERRYLFAGLADRLVPPDQVRDLWQHWERPRTLWYEGSHVSFRWEDGVIRLLREALSTSGLTRK